MRILYFLESFGLGGIESFVLNALEHETSSENSIECCAGRMTTKAFDDRISRLNVPFHCLGNDEDGFPGIRYAKCANALAAFLSGNVYDIVHIHANHGVDYLFSRVAKKCGVSRVVIHSHNTGVTKGVYKALGHRLFRDAFSRYVDGYFACSTEAAEWLLPQKRFERGDYLFVPNGIDLDSYRYDLASRDLLRDALGFRDKFVCGHVGRFNYQKNHDFLIDVFAAIHGEYEDTVLLLIGEGEFRDSVEDKVKSLGLNDCIRFLGARNDVSQILSALDVLLFPSRFEGLSVVLIEAQAADLAILASDTISPDTICSNCLSMIPLSVGEWLEAFRDVRMNEHRRGEQDLRLAPFGITNSLQLMDNGYVDLWSGGLR